MGNRGEKGGGREEKGKSRFGVDSIESYRKTERRRARLDNYTSRLRPD